MYNSIRVVFMLCRELKLDSLYIIFDQIMANNMQKEVDGVRPDDAILEIKDLYFRFDSDEIRVGIEQLEEVVDLMTRFTSINLEIVSYCDAFGPLDYNDELSKRRLKKVIGYSNKKGIASTRIQSSAVRSRRLFNNCAYLSDCSVIENQQNRRGEFFLLP